MAGEPAAIGIDIGGTKLAAGAVGPDGAVLSRARRDTPADDVDGILAAVGDVVAELAPDGGLPIGVGAAGLVDADGAVRYAPNLEWEDLPLRDVLAERLGVPVTVDNDANVAAWGEFRLGAGREASSSMVMLTIGTGVGGGLVLDGRLVRGASGMAGEMGHMVVDAGGPRCPCGNLGCLEALASGTAIGRTARDVLRREDLPVPTALRDLDELTGKSVTAVAREGDEVAVGVLASVGWWLGVGIASLVNVLDPQLVVVGGGAMQAGELLLGPARESAASHLLGRSKRSLPPIAPAALGDDAGVVGAALLALEV
jgi:glucokinase